MLLIDVPPVAHRFESLVVVLSALMVPLVIAESIGFEGAAGQALDAAWWAAWVGFVASAVGGVVATRRDPTFHPAAHWLDVLAAACTFPLLPAAVALVGSVRFVRWISLTRPGLLATRLVVSEHALVSRRAFRTVAIVTFVLVLVAGALVSVTDGRQFDNAWKGVWWAATTITTVGYGDVVPSTIAGRMIAVFVMFAGIGLVSILTAAVASALVASDVGEEERKVDEQLVELAASVDRLSRQVERLEQRIVDLGDLAPRREGIEAAIADADEGSGASAPRKGLQDH